MLSLPSVLLKNVQILKITLILNLECESGRYGIDCNDTCGYCLHGNCNHVNGTCVDGCKNGYEGNLCKKRMQYNFPKCNESNVTLYILTRSNDH